VTYKTYSESSYVNANYPKRPKSRKAIVTLTLKNQLSDCRKIQKDQKAERRL